MLYTMIASAQFSGSGTGTASDPYAIYNAMQLDQVRNFCNKTDVYFKLMDDIDLTEWIADNNPSQGWVPIGNSSSNSFRGTFDGNNHKIKGLYINRSSSDNVGLFGYVQYGNIKNVEIEGNIKGNNYVGGLVGEVYYENDKVVTSMYNCTFQGKISGNNYVGGIIGYGKAENIKIRYSYCSAEINGNSNIGGISGYLEGLHSYSLEYVIVERCFASVSIKGVSNIGGIVGCMKCATTISKCAATGNINMSSKDNSYYMGGIAGYMNKSKNISNNYHTIEDSYYMGKLIGSGKTSRVGGIVGGQVDGKVLRCYSAADIVGYEAGGIIAYMETKYNGAEVRYCISNNAIISADYPARIYYEGGNGVSDNKALFQTKIYKNGILTEVSDDRQNGTGVGAKTLMYKATYQGLGWNFTDTWNIQETECLPYFVWQTAPPVVESDLASKSTSISGKSIDGGTVYVQIGGKTYTTTATGNQWTVTTEPLNAGAEVNVYAEADGKVRSYSVLKTVGYDGEGTEENPYKIYTADDLAGINGDACYKLMNNIDVTEYINTNSPTKGWIPAATSGTESISIDGNGHTINGLWADRTEDYTGLLGNIVGGTIKNLGIKIADGKSMKGGSNSGILAGRTTNVKIENVSVEGNIDGYDNTGGIVGKSLKTSLEGVSYTGNIKAGVDVGGIVGYAEQGSISNAMYNGTISSVSTSAYIGGIVGYSMTSVSKAASKGIINATKSSSIGGGIVGINGSNGTIEDSYSAMNVTAIANAGGIAGYNYGTVTKCYATGDIKSTSCSAGVVGYNDNTKSLISNCVALNNKVEVTSSTGIVSRVLGGTKNNAPAPGKNNYALKTMAVSINGIPQTIYDDLLNGTAKQATDLYSKSTYETLGWDFSNVWKIDEGKGYPYISYSFLVPTEGNGEVNTTDISQYDNIVYVEDGVTKKGATTTLSVKLNNTNDVTGFKFSLVLPKEITVAKDEDDFYLIDLSTERTTTKKTDHFDSEKQSDGSILVTCKSTRNYAFSGNEGEVATIVVKADSQIEDDDYAITLRDVELTFANGETEKIDNVVSVLTVGEKKVCEAPVISFSNGKIVCTSATVGAVCHHTYKITDEGEDKDPDNVKIVISAYATADGLKNSKTIIKTFDFNASGGMIGDVNGDGKITMADANEIVNMYLVK